MSVSDMASEVATDACALGGDSGGVLFVDNGDTTVTPLGIVHASTAPRVDHDSDCQVQGYTSFFQNWKYACPVLNIDQCPQGRTTIGVARKDPSTSFKWLLSNDNATVGKTYLYGDWSLGDIPVVGDWDGNGTSTIGVARFDPATYKWEWILSNDNVNPIPGPHPFYGNPLFHDIPVVGDWNGDGRDTIGYVEKDPNGPRYEWFLSNDNGTTTLSPYFFGQPGLGDVPVVGDWDGNFTDTIGIARPDPASGKFKWFLSNDNVTNTGTYPLYGQPYAGDIPVVGDWNADLKYTIGVVRSDEATGRFMWILSNDNVNPHTPYIFYGRPDQNDVPVVGDWNGA